MQPSSDPIDLATIRGLLDAAADPGNPSAEELVELLRTARRIAVVGLSRHPEKPSRRVPAYLAARGYDVVPVNPLADRVLGKQAYPTLADVPGELDMVMIFRPSEEAGVVVRDAASRPEKPAIWLSEGIRADADVNAARAQGITAVQNLCAYKTHVALPVGSSAPR